MVTKKQATKSVSMEETVLYGELWYTIPYHFQRDNTRKNTVVVHTYNEVETRFTKLRFISR